MKIFGLLGYPIGHSFSKPFFEKKFIDLNLKDCRFKLFEHKKVKDFFQTIEVDYSIVGFSVTSPHKEQIIPFLNQLDDDAMQIGAVNCVKVIKQDKRKIYIGYNTDSYGFQQSVKPFLEPLHERALILGTGGAAKAVAFALKKIGIPSWFVSRNPDSKKSMSNLFSYHDMGQDIISAFKLIINTTPSEMLFGPESYPKIQYDAITCEHLCIDLIYQPNQTEFLFKSKQQGANTMNGLDMLYAQAEKAWVIWNE